MRRIKEVLRLKFEIGLSDRQIASICSIARSTVAEYLKRATKAGLSWPLPEDCDDDQLENRLFPDTGAIRVRSRSLPDFKTIHQELISHKSVTLQLLWEEYKESNPYGYQYSQFCDLYRGWAKKLDLVLRQPHRAGESQLGFHSGVSYPGCRRRYYEVAPVS